MNLLDLSGRGKEYAADIDPEIRNLVLELNELGFATVGSCSGHRRGTERLKGVEGQTFRSRPTGYINFDRILDSYEIEQVKAILNEHNIRGSRFHRQGPYGDGTYSTEVTFPPLGQ